MIWEEGRRGNLPDSIAEQKWLNSGHRDGTGGKGNLPDYTEDTTCLLATIR